MRIGIDVSAAAISGPAAGGIYQYLSHLLEELGRIAPEHEYWLFVNAFRSRPLDRCRAFLSRFRGEPFRPWVSRFPPRLRLALRVPVWPRSRLDVFHGPAHLVWRVRRTPTVVTIHDLQYRRRLPIPRAEWRAILRAQAGPGRHLVAAFDVQERFFEGLARHTEDTVRRATRIIAVSESTRADLIRLLGVPGEKIRVIHHGLDPYFVPVEDPGALRRLRQRYGLPGPFFLFVGGINPHKNLGTLLQAHRLLRTAGGSRPLLALAGHPDWFAPVLERQVADLGLQGVVRLLGFVPGEDLPALYSAATLCVVPSGLEGFGLPALEAMACGTPVVAARSGALPEVLGDAGVFADPESPADFAEACRRVLTDPGLRGRLRQGGMRRAKEFSWERAARQTLAVYREAVEGCTRPAG